MSMPEHPHAVDALLREVERQLRTHRVRRDHREAVLAEVGADLLAAEADGRDPGELVGDDVAAFVRRTVEEGGYARAPRDVGRVVALGVVGAPVAVVLGYLFFFEVVWRVGVALVDLPFRAPHLGVAVGFAGITACGVLVMLGLLAALLRGRAAARETLRAAAVAVTLAGAMGAVGNVLVLSATSRITTGSVTAQVAVVVVPLVIALVIARWAGLRRAEPHLALAS